MSHAEGKTYITDTGIVMAGSVDSGKSSFVGVLSTGKLDDGDGSARNTVAKHKHELDTKNVRTSDISTRHFKVDNRAITLIDLCGHDKYFKTTAFGMSSQFPDYAFVIVGCNRGILKMTIQHITLIMATNVPMIIFITKPDIAPQESYVMCRKAIDRQCKDLIKIPAEFINDYYDATHDTDEYKQQKLKFISQTIGVDVNKVKQTVIPVITISNKTGYYIDFTKQMLVYLHPRDPWTNFDFQNGNIIPADQAKKYCRNRIIQGFLNRIAENFTSNIVCDDVSMFYVDAVYSPPGIGVVVTGINRGKTIRTNDTIYIGPINGQFWETNIRSIHNNIKQQVDSLKNHERGTLALSGGNKHIINREFIRKGLVIVREKSFVSTNLCYRFRAVITVYHHSATLRSGYTPMIHCGNVRQSARMILDKNENDGKDIISTGQCAFVTFKFKSRPEIVEKYQTFVLRSGKVHGSGVILDIIPVSKDPDGKPDPLMKNKKSCVHSF